MMRSIWNNSFLNCGRRWKWLFHILHIINLSFSHKSDRKKEKSTVSFMHKQNIICNQTLLDGIAHEQTIICRQLFAGHVVGSRPMKRKKNLLQMIVMLACILICIFIIINILYSYIHYTFLRCYNRTAFFSFQFYRFPQVTTERCV